MAYPRIVQVLACTAVVYATVAGTCMHNATAQESRTIVYSGVIDNSSIASARSLLDKLESLILGPDEHRLSKPVDILISSQGKILVINQESGSIISVLPNGRAEKLNSSRKGVDFKSPVAACYLNEHILIADSGSDIIYRLEPDGSVTGFSEPGVLERPSGITRCNSTGEIWVTETGAHRISVFSPDGRVLRRYGQRGNHPGEFNFPTGITSDDQGKVYVVDAMNFRIQVFDSNGKFLTCFGEAGDSTGRFARPRGIAVDGEGNIYVTDLLMNNVQVFDIRGRLLSYFGGRGEGDGQLLMPSGIHISDDFNIYVCNSYNNRIEIFKLKKLQP